MERVTKLETQYGIRATGYQVNLLNMVRLVLNKGWTFQNTFAASS